MVKEGIPPGRIQYSVLRLVNHVTGQIADRSLWPERTEMRCRSQDSSGQLIHPRWKKTGMKVEQGFLRRSLSDAAGCLVAKTTSPASEKHIHTLNHARCRRPDKVRICFLRKSPSGDTTVLTWIPMFHTDVTLWLLFGAYHLNLTFLIPWKFYSWWKSSQNNIYKITRHLQLRPWWMNVEKT